MNTCNFCDRKFEHDNLYCDNCLDDFKNELKLILIDDINSILDFEDLKSIKSFIDNKIISNNLTYYDFKN